MLESVDLVVVGGGPAGLATAIEAGQLGLSVTLIDAFPQPGGQYYKRTPPGLEAVSAQNRRDSRARVLMARLPSTDVRLLSETVVWGIFEEDGYLVCLYGPPGTPRRLRPRKIVLAPGAYDRPVPFPGWTLPGVMTAGAALFMVKHQRVLPGRRILLSGTGPLQLVLAHHLVDAGAELVGILDTGRFPWNGWRHAGAVWGQWERLGEGWRAWRAVRRAGATVRWGYTVLRAGGSGRVEDVQIGPLDRSRAETVQVDTVCLGHGFIPSIQLSLQVGCKHRYRSDQGVYVPRRDEWLQTTRPGLFVAGDGAGIGGKDVAMLEGQLAAIGVALQLGQDVPLRRVSRLRRELARQRRFAAVLDDLFPYSAHWLAGLADDAILCRCEEITVGQVGRVIEQGATTVNAIRMLTRAGMGRCQGRMCGGSVAGLLASQQDLPVDAVGLATTRPPIIPVPLHGLLEAEL